MDVENGTQVYKDVIDLTRIAIQTGLLLVARQCRDAAAASVLFVVLGRCTQRPYHASARGFPFSVFRFHISVRSILK